MSDSTRRGTRLRILLALGALLGASLAWGQRVEETPNSQASAKLSLSAWQDDPSWLLDTAMDGAAYSWRLRFREGDSYSGLTAALLRKGYSPLLITDSGRLAQAGVAGAALTALAEKARSRSEAEDARATQLETISAEDCYYMGYTAMDFAYASSAGKVAAPARALDRKARWADIALPSPALLGQAGPVEILLVLSRADSDRSDCLLVSTVSEYFEGEAEFFASKPGYRSLPYVKKALALMSTTFDEEPKARSVYREAALANNPGVAMNEAEWGIFAGNPDLPWQQRKLGTHFLNTMLSPRDRDGDSGELITPGLESPSWFEGLYGLNRQVYVSSYVAFWFRYEAPLYMTEIEETHDYYAETVFVAITEAEGQELAQAAKRRSSSGSPGFEASSAGRGADALGFLTSLLSTTSFRDQVENADGERLTRAGIALTGRNPAGGVQRFDLEAITATVPALALLRPGDLVLRYGSGESSADNPFRLAVVVSVPTTSLPLPGSDPTVFLRQVIVAGAEPGASRGRLLNFLSDSPGASFSAGDSFQFRRLLKRR